MLERNPRISGGCTTEATVFPGFRLNPTRQLLHGCPLIGDLELYRYGFSYIEPPVQQAAVFRDGTAIVIYKDLERSCASLTRFSEWRH